MPTIALPRISVVGFTLATSGVFGLAALTWDQTQQTQRAQSWVNHTQEVMTALGSAESQLFRAEANQRSYLVDMAPEFALRREAAVGELLGQLDALARLTVDNTAQRGRLGALRSMIELRVREFRTLQSRLEAGQELSAKDRLAEGANARALISPRFQEMVNEEARLLAFRQDAERQRTSAARGIFIGLVAGLALLLAGMLWRLGVDAGARRRAELAAAQERSYDTMHVRALTLYNETTTREEALSGTLELLANSPLFPVSAFYAHEEIGGALRLTASRGAPADTCKLLHVDDGVIGATGRSGKPIYLESLDAANGLRIETGLAVLRPAALLIAPVSHQGKLFGVLSLAVAQQLDARARAFVDRLCAQLAIALHNLEQVEGLNQFASELRDTAEQIHQKNEQLKRASQMKSEFVANMSHELRTPLNAVIGFSEILRDGVAGELNDQQREYVGDIHESGTHLLSLINDVLDLSKIESGKMTLRLEAATASGLSVSALAVMRESASARQVELTSALAPQLGEVWIDTRKAKQIVYNLLSNAVKFTPEGGRVELSFNKVDRRALESAHAAEDQRVFPPQDLAPEAWLQISVTDSGIGISPEDLRRLFQPFVQADSRLSRSHPGTGLGLTMVQRLVELHGGGMFAKSVPGRGSTFTVWLPWRDRPADASEASHVQALSPKSTVSAATPRVLVIEDDPNTANVLNLLLLEGGYQPQLAYDADRGLELAALLRPDAILLDILLPDVDGWNVLARLKEHPATRHIPVVIVSITDEPQRAFALGAAQVLMKPVSQAELLFALGAAGLLPYNGSGRVLVVDDDPKAVTVLCEVLRAGGFSPVGAFGGQQALEEVARARPDLILLDLMMPHVSGFDVLEALRGQADTADLPIVVLTAKLMSPREHDALRARVQHIMDKADFLPASLLAELSRALSKVRHANHQWSSRRVVGAA